jgi:hypothetical protein
MTSPISHIHTLALSGVTIIALIPVIPVVHSPEPIAALSTSINLVIGTTLRPFCEE